MTLLKLSRLGCIGIAQAFLQSNRKKCNVRCFAFYELRDMSKTCHWWFFLERLMSSLAWGQGALHTSIVQYFSNPPLSRFCYTLRNPVSSSGPCCFCFSSDTLCSAAVFEVFWSLAVCPHLGDHWALDFFLQRLLIFYFFGHRHTFQTQQAWRNTMISLIKTHLDVHFRSCVQHRIVLLTLGFDKDTLNPLIMGILASPFGFYDALVDYQRKVWN